MDFGSLLDYAKQNEKPNKEVKCYRTSFAPPKKEPKSKCLSQNIQKFLARKEEEERQKKIEAIKKREELCALRAQDSKANKRVRAMLKSTKAANKAAIDDARDDVNTAVTMAGPSQPDEDDYGYVSQEASAFYNKLMDKYVSTPSNEPNFSKKVLSVKDITSTKDRVRMALLKEEEEESMPHKRKRRRKDEMKSKTDDDDNDSSVQYGAPDRNVSDRDSASRYVREKPEPEVKKRKPAAPPPMDFAELLKVAAQKQFEPIKIEKKDKGNNEDERPMTKKQREEFLREKQYRQRKEEMARIAAAKSKEKKQQPSSSQVQADAGETEANLSTKSVPTIPRIPKVNGNKPVSESQTRVSGCDSDMQGKRNSLPQQMSSRDGGNVSKPRQPETGRLNSLKPPSSSREQENRPADARKSSNLGNSRAKDFPREERKPMPVQNVPLSKERRPSLEDKKQHISQMSKPVIKEERRQINQPSKSVIKEERRPAINQPLKTVIKEDKRPTISQPLKPVIKEERRPTTNQSSKPVIKEERKQMNQAPRPIKEEKKMPPPESSRVPPKLGKPTSAPLSKPSQTLQQGGGSSKSSVNSSKKLDERISKTSPAGRIPPVGNSMLKDRLTSSNNQSLPQKSNNPSSNVKKEARMDVPSKVQSRSSSPPVRPTLPKEVSNRNPGSRPQAIGMQGTSRDGARGNQPPDRRSLPAKGEMRRPPSMYDRGPPGKRGFPPDRRGPMYPHDARRRPPPKRRIESDDEYDSELDDFIDDGPEESEDYSKYIKEIFGYDKSRYRAIDYEDEDECMESNYAQQMKEEFVSTKLGIMEDLEDIKKEQMEKKRKIMALSKKRKL